MSSELLFHFIMLCYFVIIVRFVEINSSLNVYDSEVFSMHGLIFILKNTRCLEWRDILKFSLSHLSYFLQEFPFHFMSRDY